MNIGQGKVFEKPVGGTYIGTIIDIVDTPAQRDPRTGQPILVLINGAPVEAKDKIRIQWVLAHENNAPYLDKEGNSMTVTGFYNATITMKGKQSNLAKVLIGVLNGQVPLIQTTEQLEQVVLGRSNRLMITQEPDQKNAGEYFSNIVGILPLNPGQNPVPVPQGFVRSRFRVKQAAGPQGTPVPTYATREAALQAGQPGQLTGNTVNLGRPTTTGSPVPAPTAGPGPEAF